MKIKALITTLVIAGSSSVAMARPVTVSASAEASWRFGTSQSVRDHRYEDRPVVVNHRDGYRRPDVVTVLPAPMHPNNNNIGADASEYVGPRPVVTKRARYESRYSQSSWMAITAPTRIDAGRQFIRMGAELGSVNRLRLQNTAGESSISQVAIRFVDGQTQVIRVDQKLDRWNPSIALDLDGSSRQIEDIIVYGTTARGSAYQVFAL
jgi:hypothetical protein